MTSEDDDVTIFMAVNLGYMMIEDDAGTLTGRPPERAWFLRRWRWG